MSVTCEDSKQYTNLTAISGQSYVDDNPVYASIPSSTAIYFIDAQIMKISSGSAFEVPNTIMRSPTPGFQYIQNDDSSYPTFVCTASNIIDGGVINITPGRYKAVCVFDNGEGTLYTQMTSNDNEGATIIEANESTITFTIDASKLGWVSGNKIFVPNIHLKQVTIMMNTIRKI